MGEDKWWEGVANTELTYMHLKVTDKRQGKDNEVYIYECKNTTQKLVDIVDQVLLQNGIVAWGGNVYIEFRPAWKPNTTVKIYGSAAAKKSRLAQLAVKLVEGPGTVGCLVGEEEKYEKKIMLSTEDPPMVEVTLGIDKVVVEGGGFMTKRNSKVSPEGAMGSGTGVAVVAPIPVTPDKENGQALGDSHPQMTPLQQTVSQQAMEAVAARLLTPVSGGNTAGEPRTAEPVPKMAKLTPVSTPCGSPAGELAMGGLQVVDKGKEVFHNAQNVAGEMDVEAEGETQ
jgi:hypothetical protein